MRLNEYARKIAVTLLLEGLKAVDPQRLILERVKVEEGVLRAGGREQDVRNGVYVVALGKAAGEMARAVEELLGELVRAGVAAVPRGSPRVELRRVRVIEAGHPYPDEGSLEAARLALKLAQAARQEKLPLLVLISGGGSALMEMPAPGLTLDDLRRTTELLLKAGATIDEINAVRKHLSAVKGGQLAAAAHPSPVLSLVISDVVGDRLDVIASGPTSPDPTTYSDARSVLERYGLLDKVPQAVLKVLEEGRKGERPETPKPGDPRLEGVANVVIGNNMTALLAMEAYARRMGLNAVVLSSMIQGEAREAAKFLAAIALEVKRSSVPVAPPAAVICGGETVV
ncbi:MAG: glycerate kinase, partial [Thermoprotei archaeon]